MSDWVKNSDRENPYALADMANDGMAVLDALGIAKAHVVGVSMDGMVAQQMPIEIDVKTIAAQVFYNLRK